jgi:hypothetical protein
MTFTRAQSFLKHGHNAAPLKRGEVAEIAKAVKKYKLRDDITVNNRKNRRVK